MVLIRPRTSRLKLQIRRFRNSDFREFSLEVRLEAQDGAIAGQTVSFGTAGGRVGRHTSNDLVVPEAGISRYHCEIGFAPELPDPAAQVWTRMKR